MSESIIGHSLSAIDWFQVYEDAFQLAIEKRIVRTPFATIIASEAVPPGKILVYPPMTHPTDRGG